MNLFVFTSIGLRFCSFPSRNIQHSSDYISPLLQYSPSNEKEIKEQKEYRFVQIEIHISIIYSNPIIIRIQITNGNFGIMYNRNNIIDSLIDM